MSKVTKKSQARTIFAGMLLQREAGKFATMKDFRQTAIKRFQAEIADVSGSASCTLYNQMKDAANKADPLLKLGRDPAKSKSPKSGIIKKAAQQLNVPVVDLTSSETVTPEDISGMPVRTGPITAEGLVDTNPVDSLSSDHLYEDIIEDVVGIDVLDAIHGSSDYY